MQINKHQNSGKYQKQENIVQGREATEDHCSWSEADFHSYSKSVDTNWAKSVKDIFKWTNIPCRHVLSGRIRAHKVCVKNYECYHCAYDQMIDDEDMELLDEKTACSNTPDYFWTDRSLN